MNGIGNITDPNVIAKSTVEMQTQGTFTDAGWDFFDETVNGSDDTWRMCVDGVEYPQLWWDFTAGDFACPDGVTFIDFAVFSEAWLTSAGQPSYNEDYDLVDDDIINLADLQVFAENWLQGI